MAKVAKIAFMGQVARLYRGCVYLRGRLLGRIPHSTGCRAGKDAIHTLGGTVASGDISKHCIQLLSRGIFSPVQNKQQAKVDRLSYLTECIWNIQRRSTKSRYCTCTFIFAST